MQEVNTVIGMLNTSGLKGGQAGTSFAAAMRNMVKAFLGSLNKQTALITGFDEQLWHSLSDHVQVCGYNSAKMSPASISGGYLIRTNRRAVPGHP
jgi:hypothetical protein